MEEIKQRRPGGMALPQHYTRSPEWKAGFMCGVSEFYHEAINLLGKDDERLDAEIHAIAEEVLPSEAINEWMDEIRGRTLTSMALFVAKEAAHDPSKMHDLIAVLEEMEAREKRKRGVED